ncbi:MAG: sel1 repeat family protein [Alphaproteobacteria bacterium]|nr:sel1 repeat family protein [Alphaproteobacteria bacterium]
MGNAHADFDAGLNAYKEEDFAKALAEWKPLAEQGDVQAQFYLGLIYGFGQGVEKDLVEAVRWWQLAAERGNIAAQSNLGFMYKYGNGVPQDIVLAYMWSKIAALGGATFAQQNLKVMSKEMTAADIEKAEQLAREWRESHPATSQPLGAAP